MQTPMTLERVKDILEMKYKGTKGTYQQRLQAYQNGKTFISMHVSTSAEYDECIQLLIKLTRI